MLQCRGSEVQKSTFGVLISLYNQISIASDKRFLQMDWQGQRLAETLMQIMLVAFAGVAFLTGYFSASFQMMLLIYMGGVVLTALASVPNWPFFNRHPLKWLDPIEAEKHPKPESTSSSSKQEEGL
ncbi:putative signal peptidase complex subunit 1 [Heracleum sosnowskyi]|uniref:Signal peptidase complex subunit 1 n=1 Tax=Heracleum sosnowskyi TaxID=360622 RepID=A0AAD8MGG2_9APIA|nr:putative signal peptidase complex subunit 1 [Heracleum sosnowskyi]